jgi:hypothetical protein
MVQSDTMGGFSYVDFELTLIVADKVNNTLNDADELGEESNNGTEVSSDTLQIINDIIAEMSQAPYYVTNSIKLQGDVVTNPVFDEDDGRVNGWTADLTLRMPFHLTSCGSPMTQLSGSVASTIVTNVYLKAIFTALVTDMETLTINAASAGTFTAITDDGGSGAITVNVNGGGDLAFVNPTTLSVGDTLLIKRATNGSVGWVQLEGTQ